MLWISRVPTASLFLLLLPCFPGQNGEENEQSTDIISVWEGDSISITCSLGDSENDLGTYLRTKIPLMNVVYFSKQNLPYINPNWASHLEYSKEGQNLRIILHKVQSSDSNIYLCTKYILKDRHKKLDGKRTIVVVKAKTSGIIDQSPLYANPQQKQSVSITCALKGSHEDDGVYLLKTHTQREEVLYVSSQEGFRIHPAFVDRLEYSKEGEKIVITLHNLQKTDSDIYVCAGVMKNSTLFSANGSGTMMLVREVEPTDCSNSPWGIYGLIIVVALLISVLTGCALYRVNIKKFFQREKKNTVYEDMSYSSRRSTLVRSNTYSAGN
ncbi:CD7 protein, partial [Brachypteracias leptosomus]|nr:CD7 protein [Brachypteracias leptosomus]